MDKPTPFKLKLFSKCANFMIPFNHPHKFNVENISNSKSTVTVPYIRRNFNHLRGVHACAIATMGEFAAGIVILKNFDFANYRLILSKLEVEYFYQGKTKLQAQAKLPSTEIKRLKDLLQKNDAPNVTVTTKIVDEKNNHIANVFSTWQLKSWSNVKTKL